MMGQVLPSVRVPVVKGCNGILALTPDEVRSERAMPCIRCASCVGACPCGLVPLEMAAYIRAGDLEGATRFGLADCIACGSCAYVCPSRIPLVQYFNHAKGEVAARERARVKQEETRRLAAQKTERLERMAQAKREALARRKAEMAARKQAEAEARA
jgi:electron transport complex protein RnfC